MPTITVNLKDMYGLIGKPLDRDEFERLLALAKAEFKDHDPETGEARIELNDTNRPDLWCAEGIARQIRSHLKRAVIPYPVFHKKEQPGLFVEVDPGLEKIRPYVAAFTAKGPGVTEAFLVQMIQTQEKLCENYGRRRLNVAIGIYNASKIVFPVRYVAAQAGDYPFVPLGSEERLPLDRILEEHPKGKEYGHLIRGFSAFPLLIDSDKKVLSLPPVINSRETGEVMVGDTFLFIEATGHEMRQLVLAMNIMAANFWDRGWEVSPVETRLPYDSELGKTVRVPTSLETSLRLDLGLFERTFGESYTAEEVASALEAYGVSVTVEGKHFEANCPPYRDDFLHPMDVVEDFAISRGYHSFEPEMPSRFTVGKLKPVTLLIDRIRDHMVGLGFEEIISNILSNRRLEREHMLLSEEPLVEIDNVMSETYSVLRSSILPSLLRVEAQSAKALYPHRLFEASEVCLKDQDAVNGTRTEQRLTALWASAESGFSQIHSVLDMLLYYLVKDYTLRPVSMPFYFEGRAGEVVIAGRTVGHIGEIHPEVLTNFGITMPCAAFEIHVDAL